MVRMTTATKTTYSFCSIIYNTIVSRWPNIAHSWILKEHLLVVNGHFDLICSGCTLHFQERNLKVHHLSPVQCITSPITVTLPCWYEMDFRGENRKLFVYIIGVSLSKPHTSGTTLHLCVYVCLDRPLTVTCNFSISVEGTAGNEINATGTWKQWGKGGTTSETETEY